MRALAILIAIIAAGAAHAAPRRNIVVPPPTSCAVAPPPQAVAAGYNTLALCNPLNNLSGIDLGNSLANGFLFYSQANGVTNAANDYVTNGKYLTILSVPKTAAPPVTVPINGNTLEPGGTTISGGFYIEADVAFNAGYNAAGDGTLNSWPGFWLDFPADAVNETNGSTIGYTELDIFEWYSAGMITTVHQWFASNNHACDNLNNSVTFSPGNGFHRYGLLLIPSSQNSGTGVLKWYIDNTLVTTVTYSGNGLPSSSNQCVAGAFQTADSQPFAILLQPGTTGAGGAGQSAAASFKNLHVWKSATGLGYYGAGDMNPGAEVFYSTMAYSNAYANAHSKIMAVTLSTNSHTCDILAASSGDLGNTANCSNSGDNGTAAATFCGSNCTVNTLYDQSGGNNCGGSPCDLTQSTAANQPALVFNDVNGHAGIRFSGAAQILSRASSPTLAQPFTYSEVWNNTSSGCASSTCAIFVSDSAGNYVGNWLEDDPGVFQFNIQATANSSGVTADNAYAQNTWNSSISIFNSQSSVAFINGATVATTGTVGTGGMANTLSIGNDTFGENFVGDIAEIGAWPGSFSVTQLPNMCHSEYMRFATATAC